MKRIPHSSTDGGTLFNSTIRLHCDEAKRLLQSSVNFQVKGTGLLASLLRKLLYHLALGVDTSGQRSVTNKQCVPHPRAMPAIYFFKIYGGYVWILLLLYVNPYTLRLRR